MIGGGRSVGSGGYGGENGDSGGFEPTTNLFGVDWVLFSELADH